MADRQWLHTVPDTLRGMLDEVQPVEGIAAPNELWAALIDWLVVHGVTSIPSISASVRRELGDLGHRRTRVGALKIWSALREGFIDVDTPIPFLTANAAPDYSKTRP